MALVRWFMIHEKNFEMLPGWNQEFHPLLTLDKASVKLLNWTMLARILAIVWLNAT